MIRKDVQQRLVNAITTADDTGAVFCIEPFSSVERDGGDNLGRLLARLIRDPDHTFVVATTNAFVFAFGGELANGRNEDGASSETDAVPAKSTQS